LFTRDIFYTLSGPEKFFQATRLQPLEIIDELFADTVVICHHEKLPNNSFATI